ncbi:MAG: OsmC family protein [Gammaproteobacteria bacterium]|nr:OsmC family protein [Gammaproteobacteria bacterium]MDH3467545.1 OsmC family protein [Gammaproteobacteria bacterium]MDH3639641.1 OsmC family protein [Gammaproteobacteria bacterium]
MSQATVKEACSKLAGGIADNPANAKVHYSAEVVWDGDVHCTSRVRHFEPLGVDEPEVFGGGDKEQSPADLVLSSFGACQGIMYAAIASAMDIELTSVRFKLKGELDLRGLLGMGKNEGIPAGFQNIRYETIIESPATEEQLQNLVNTVESQCPLLDTLQRPIDVSGSVTINGAPGYVGNKEAA